MDAKGCCKGSTSEDDSQEIIFQTMSEAEMPIVIPLSCGRHSVHKEVCASLRRDEVDVQKVPFVEGAILLRLVALPSAPAGSTTLLSPPPRVLPAGICISSYSTAPHAPGESTCARWCLAGERETPWNRSSPALWLPSIHNTADTLAMQKAPQDRSSQTPRYIVVLGEHSTTSV